MDLLAAKPKHLNHRQSQLFSFSGDFMTQKCLYLKNKYETKKNLQTQGETHNSQEQKAFMTLS